MPIILPFKVYLLHFVLHAKVALHTHTHAHFDHIWLREHNHNSFMLVTNCSVKRLGKFVQKGKTGCFKIESSL